MRGAWRDRGEPCAGSVARALDHYQGGQAGQLGEAWLITARRPLRTWASHSSKRCGGEPTRWIVVCDAPLVTLTRLERTASRGLAQCGLPRGLRTRQVRSGEVDHGAVQGKFVSAGTGVCGCREWQCSGWLQPKVVIPQPLGYLAEQVEVVEDVGLAVGREECRRGEQLEVQVWR